MSSKPIKKLIQQHWQFLDADWPVVTRSKFHRTELKPVKHMDYVKKVLLDRLGIIPVYFFLVCIWCHETFPGPYREVDKGLLVLFYLVKGVTTEAMQPYMPKSSFYAIYDMMFKKEYKFYTKMCNGFLDNMFSTFEIRLRSAKEKNPPLFKHVTILLDGHDTRATYTMENKAEAYSYKLKKPGLRTQVAIDVNGMALMVSQSAPCKDNSDGSMLVDMKIHKKIHELDCVALDGGYTLFLDQIIEGSDLTYKNFACPIRKKKTKDLAKDQLNYNSIFGSFRSMMEDTFGELGLTFDKHNNKVPVRVDRKKTYNLMLRLCLVLQNVKTFVHNNGIEPLPHHALWLEQDFEYPTNASNIPDTLDLATVASKLEFGDEISRLQDEFLSMGMDEDVDDVLEESEEEELQTNRRSKRAFVEAVEICRKK